ncbi:MULTISPECIES: hypothetical protein [unclassified Brenneria]|uniref:hypothetical protein n=1 Tax=unclassified Brenneria TaxID=2634434 RepID=UPI0029C5E751|nr:MULTISPECIES: hypothetical protein [unclassified Brenneria]MDX5628460.1 hypothetical protein [Brenneria sp. L3-3Z]MDX5695357.1 hypothetical protein [Brenneria sp. L4-2C]
MNLKWKLDECLYKKRRLPPVVKSGLRLVLRDIGLLLADNLPGVKPTLVRQAMGLNDLPAWLDEQR